MIGSSQKSPAALIGGPSPMLLPALAAAWRAIWRWTPEFLGSLADERLVTVVVGNRERDAPRFATIPLRTFFAHCFTEPATENRAYYLKEYDLLGAFPALSADLELAPFRVPNARSWRYAWVGQRGGRTGFHYDVYHNILTQLVGTKELVLIPPTASFGMYESPKFDYGARLSRVDGFRPDFAQFPRFRDALLHSRRFTLSPGDALYIPRGWWHQAECLTPTISLSGFTATRWQQILVAWPEELRRRAHRLGIYKRGHCTCHPGTASRPAPDS